MKDLSMIKFFLDTLLNHLLFADNFLLLSETSTQLHRLFGIFFAMNRY